MFLSIRGDRPPITGAIVAALAGLAGLAVGVLTSYGQSAVSGAAEAFVNSASAWLVASFAVGALFPRARHAAWAGLACCLMQLIGYDLTSELRGLAVSTSLDAFWAIGAIIGGPLFGLAGHAWRHGRPGLRGLGPATLAAAFATEGAWNYLHELHRPLTGALWIGIATAIALVGVRGVRGWRWLALTLPAGIVAELALTTIIR